MRARHIAIGAGVVVLLGTLIWLALPKRIASDSTPQLSAATDIRAARSAEPRAQPEPVERADTPSPSPSPSPTIAIVDASERARLSTAIRTARQARRRTKSAPALPQPQAAAVHPTAHEPDEEPLDAEHVRAQIQEIKPLLAECYDVARARVPELEGDLQMRFTIEGEPAVGGIVSESQVAGGSLAEHAEFATCVRETLYTLKLPAPEAGGMMVVAYPFVFAAE